MWQAELTSALAIFLLALAAVVSALAMPQGVVGSGMGPGVLPLWIGTALACLSVLLIARSLRSGFVRKTQQQDGQAGNGPQAQLEDPLAQDDQEQNLQAKILQAKSQKAPDRQEPLLAKGEALAVTELFLTLAIYVLAIDLLGFGSATVGLVAILARRLGRYALWRCLLYGVLVGAIAILVFRELLTMPLPGGWSGF
ncbi:tripartite tricarboxylate transporter TctB family protein [Heliomicrobium undosum]|nr:tripartite tricarboxylate transporter TctB family protein [Heliomicrobium undosum]